MRIITATILCLATLASASTRAQEGMIDGGRLALAGYCDSWADNDPGLSCQCGSNGAHGQSCSCGACGSMWLESVKVGYDSGFVIASRRELDLKADRYPYQLKINGWGQLRHTISDLSPPNQDLNQFQLKRGRLVFSGSAFTPDFSYFVQLDGRSSSGDDMRLLDYYLSFDVGHKSFGLDPGTFGFRTGKYKMPFTMARWMSGREFAFTDRSVASMFFDVNRSFAWGLYGETERFNRPFIWEAAIFNGLVTGGAETGSAGTLDDNFAYSARINSVVTGDWGNGEISDFDWHERLAMRIGFGFASTQIDRSGDTEFNSLRVVDSGRRLANLLPIQVASYSTSLYSFDVSTKYRGWSTTLEYYFRNVKDFNGAAVPDLFDHGMWLQMAYFIVPDKVQLLGRWSRVTGNSGTLGGVDQSSDEVAGGVAYYFRENHSKFVADVTRLDSAPINSSALDISPRDRGWLIRSQVQFSF